MNSINKFCVIKLASNTDIQGFEVLYAKLAIVEPLELPLSDKCFDFLMLRNSEIAKQLINNQEKSHTIDLSEFSKGNLGENSVEVFLHNDYVNALIDYNNRIEKERTNAVENNSEYGLGIELEDIIHKCLLVHHTDMYFTSIFRYVIYNEYEKIGLLNTANLYEAYEHFKKAATAALYSIVNVGSHFFNEMDESELIRYKNKYSEIIDYGRNYTSAIPTFLHSKQSVGETVTKYTGDKSPHFQIFTQMCMFIGFEIANRRISNNIENTNYFNHEIFEHIDTKVIKIYPTPYCSLFKNKIVELAKKGEHTKVLDEYLLSQGYYKLNKESLVSKLSTSFIYKKDNEKGIYYFKRRPKDLDYMPFGEQDREDPVRGLVLKGQLNLTYLEY
jgi:hypothetical protein